MSKRPIRRPVLVDHFDLKLELVEAKPRHEETKECLHAGFRADPCKCQGRARTTDATR